jgi:hypothetical protein
VSDAFREGRAFLLGDAAHVHSPAGGQGMNTGMQDAFNLGWKLAAVVNGSADSTADSTADSVLLDSYQAERHPVAATVIEQTTRMTNLGTLDHEVQQVLRNTAIHLAGRLTPVRHMLAAQMEETTLTYRDSPIVGGRRRHSGVRPGDSAPDVAGTDLRERLVAGGIGTTALIFGTGSADGAPALSGLRQIRIGGDPASAEQGPDRVQDPDGRIARRYGAHGGDVVLVRPDGYVGFVGSLSDTDAIAAYRSVAGCAGTGRRSSNVSDAPSMVAASASAAVS